MTITAEQWQAKGRFISVAGREVFVVDTDDVDKPEKPVLAILHGYPTSSYDYYKVIESLSANYRVIVHDHLGFGLSDKPLDYSYSLIEQADIALQLWRELEVSSVTLLAHDYGTSVLTELLARDNQKMLPITLLGAVVCNGSMHIEMANLRLIQKLLRNRKLGPIIARLSSRNTVARNLKNIYADPDQLEEREIDVIWEMMNHNNGKAVLPQLSQYMKERYQFWQRWIGALQTTRLPLGIVWPDSDPIAGPDMAQTVSEETRNSKRFWVEGTGHFPMLEAPEQWTSQVTKALSWLEKQRL